MKRQIYLLLFMMMGMIGIAQTKQNDTIHIKEVRIDVTKQNQKSHNIPMSVTAFNAKAIETLKIDDITDIKSLIPNVFIPKHGTRLNTDIYIRGVGTSKGEPSVGIYVDDIPYFDSGTVNFEFANISKIELLRGPQGTLYGRNAMGGLLKIYTPDPVFERKADIKLDYSRFNTYKIDGNYNQVISDKIAFNFNTFYKHSDGFFTNKFDNKKVDAEKTYGWHSKFRFDISDKLKARLLLSCEKSNQPGFAYGVYDSNTQTVNDVNYNNPSKYERKFRTAGLNLKYEASLFDINFSTSFQKLIDTYLIDQDFTPNDIYAVDMNRNNNAIVEELSFKSKPDSKLKWIGGLFAFQRDLLKDVDFSINGSHGKMNFLKNYNQKIYGFAGYGQADYSIHQFVISTGLRYDLENAQLDYNYDLKRGENTTHKTDFNHQLKFNQILPKLSLSYLPDNNTNIYTSITKGYKAGGFNATIERDEDETFEPEYSINYETGVKLRSLKNKLITNFSLFYIDWDHQQVVQSVPSGRGTMIKNAGKSESKGVEFETQYLINHNLDFALNFGYDDAKFIKYKYNDTKDYTGNQLPLVPKYTFSTIMNYKWRLNKKAIKYVLFNVNYNRFGKYYWTADNADYQKSYGLLNANIKFVLKKANIGFWAKNITNEKYNKYYFTISTLHKAYAEASKPVQFGVFIKYKF